MTYQTLPKLKSCFAKDPFITIKRQLSSLDKIYENYISNKGLESRIYLELLSFNREKRGGNNPIRKGSKDMQRHFNYENIQANRHM